MFVVVTKSGWTSEAAKAEILDLAKRSRRIAEAQPGLIGFTTHLATDDSHTLTYWQWRAEADHWACMSSPDWGPLAERWEALQAEGLMTFEIATYTPV